MNKTIIQAPKDAIYLSDFIKELPKGILNKKSTGCGATTLAIEDNNPTILVSPLRELIDNKCAQYPNDRCSYTLQPVYSGISDDTIKEYLSKTETPKILVTYDSFKRLKELINASDYRVIVDEYQELLKAYGFRSNAVNSLLEEIRNYQYVTYLSATPIAPEFTPIELNNQPYTEIEWANTVNIKPIRYKTNKPYNAVVNIINRYKAGDSPIINGIKSTEAYFFINSVKAIADIIDNANLKQNEVKIICADTSANRNKLGLFNINKALDPNKQFTFITSSAFIGCDFYSESGVTFIISNCSSNTTLLDISTDIFQIAGRIRTVSNPFKNTIFHIYNNSTAETNRAEFDNYIEVKKKQTNALIRDWKKFELDTKEWVKYKINNISESDFAYYNELEDKLEFNDFKLKSEMFRYNIINELYKNGISIREAYIKAGFDTSTAQQYERFTDKFITKATKRKSFNELCIEYIELAAQKDYSSEFRMMAIAEEYPLISQAYRELGAEKIISLGYNQTKIKNELFTNSFQAKNAIYYEFRKVIKSGDKILNAELKEITQKIYNKLGIKKSAKATDINDYYDTKPIKITVDNIRLNGLEIIKTK